MARGDARRDRMRAMRKPEGTVTELVRGYLEIDSDRGVIYFHTDDKEVAERVGGITVLRICRLPTPVPLDKMLDVTLSKDVGVSW